MYVYGNDKMSNQFMRRKTNRKYRYEDDDAHVGLLDNSDNEDVGNEEIKLQVRRKRNTDFLKHEVKEGDTLSSLSLHYNCTISQIKQLNNIHRDNEIFALRVVRIPIIPFSVVTEKIAKAQSAPSDAAVSGSDTNTQSDKYESVNLPQDILVNTSLGHNVLDADSSSDISVCNPLLTPLPVPIVLNPSPVIDPEVKVVATTVESPSNITSAFLQCNGADCGIPWVMLFVCTLALGFVGPLIYIFFLYEGKSKLAESSVHP